MSRPSPRDHDAVLADLDARLTRLTSDVEDLASLTRADAPAAADAASQPESHGFPVPPVYTSAEVWVREFVVEVFQRPFGGEVRWCASWQDHPEAVLRLEAMWRAWEVLHQDDGLGLSRWLLSHFDPSFTVLTGRTGPFARCTVERHVA